MSRSSAVSSYLDGSVVSQSNMWWTRYTADEGCIFDKRFNSRSGFLVSFLRQSGRIDTRSKLVDIDRLLLILFSKFYLDRLELLAQVRIPAGACPDHL